MPSIPVKKSRNNLRNPYAKLVKNFKLHQLIEAGRDENLSKENIPFLIESIKSVLLYVNYHTVRGKLTSLMFEDIHQDYLEAIDVLKHLSGAVPYRWITEYYFLFLGREHMRTDWHGRMEYIEKLSNNIELALKSEPNNWDFVLDKVRFLAFRASESNFGSKFTLDPLFEFLQITALTTKEKSIWSNWLACLNLLRKAKGVEQSYTKKAIQDFVLTSQLRLDEGTLAADTFVDVICDPELKTVFPKKIKEHLSLFVTAAIAKQKFEVATWSADELERQSGIYIRIFDDVVRTREVITHAKVLAERSWESVKTRTTLNNFVAVCRRFAMFIKKVDGDEAGCEALLTETEEIKKNFEALETKRYEALGKPYRGSKKRRRRSSVSVKVF